MIRNQPDMAHVTAGRVRVGPLRHLPELLQGFGVALDPLLDGLGLPTDLMGNPENTVSVASAAELLALCRSRLQAVEQQVKVLDGAELKAWEGSES